MLVDIITAYIIIIYNNYNFHLYADDYSIHGILLCHFQISPCLDFTVSVYHVYASSLAHFTTLTSSC